MYSVWFEEHSGLLWQICWKSLAHNVLRTMFRNNAEESLEIVDLEKTCKHDGVEHAETHWSVVPRFCSLIHASTSQSVRVHLHIQLNQLTKDMWISTYRDVVARWLKFCTSEQKVVRGCQKAAVGPFYEILNSQPLNHWAVSLTSQLYAFSTLFGVNMAHYLPLNTDTEKINQSGEYYTTTMLYSSIWLVRMFY